jgi:hypothetical protein
MATLSPSAPPVFGRDRRGLLQSVGIKTTEVAESVVAEKNQPLYWLAFAARHDRALDFWEKIRELEPGGQGDLGF